ncbi:metal-dependent hydrolase [Paenibacillus hemerocallicola]|uniref:Metal-dependent hydrolase n=1 Tax=Paenibacillus hemerocallicola TaxID=1172614 RepID=A0A5C4T3Y6_9BACL|nr:metal-dependent hydrolase [Paenibacillus hemerocallicola]TNJ63794.1 metal-dependent hydrolase [Paenibacillus hemerocallicola]
MDTITHTFFGLALYGAVDKAGMTPKQKRALLFTTVAGSQIPDIDVISAWWDTSGRYQMWHRGITHSLLMVPVWAGLLALFARTVFRQRGWLWFQIALIAVFIHDTSDIFNAWGTGYFEPLSDVRLTFGTVPIVDLVFWAMMGGGLLVSQFGRGRWSSHRVFRTVWVLMALHVAIQTAQGMTILQQAKGEYEQVALSADFVPGVFTVIGKKDAVVTLQKGSVWTGLERIATLESKEEADLDSLFAANPKAATLMQWAPFVVIVDNGERIGLYDPRFYRNGQSFLFEYMDRK